MKGRQKGTAMRARLTVYLTATLLLAAWPFQLRAQSPQQAELDALWAEVSRTVAEGDFAAYSAVYHEDAVLISGPSGTSVPISQALRDWEPGFIETQRGETEPTVEFRFTQRLHDETTAHETGIFKFTSQVPGGEPASQYVHFEALLVKRDGWLMVMEYQKSAATAEDWEAAR